MVAGVIGMYFSFGINVGLTVLANGVAMPKTHNAIAEMATIGLK